jgi:glucose-6-phosphate dehydrogenase assembly protein OpcA
MPATIKPDKILRELNQVWAALGQPDAGGGSDGVLRACAMTLIVVTEGPPDDSSLTETIAALMRDHPSRAIVIRLGSGHGRDLSASVNAQCWKPFGSRQQICCELIEIQAALPALEDLAPVLRGLAAPDLPLILWLREQALLELPPFELGDKLIVNTAGAPDAPRALARIAGLATGSRLVADLSWTRLTRWREIIGHIFASPARLAKISDIDQVTVKHLEDAVPVRALYMTAWLRNRLGDRPSYQLKPVSPSGAVNRSSEVQGVSLRGTGIDISIELCDNDSAQLRLDHLELREAFSVPSEYELLREELTMLGKDTVYEAVRSLAQRLVSARSSPEP